MLQDFTGLLIKHITEHTQIIYNVYNVVQCHLQPTSHLVQSKEGNNLTMHSTHFIYNYVASDHSDSDRGKPTATTTRATLFD